MKTTLTLLLLLFVAISSTDAQTLISANEVTAAKLEQILKSAGIGVVESQPAYVKIIQDSNLKIGTYLDIDAEKQYLIFNGSNALKEGATAALAKALVSDINTQTNFIKAGYNEEKNSIEFRYYFWIKDGFTDKSLISALEMYRLTYIYAFSVDKGELLK